MRDLKGNATRAVVDISLMQVPEYQVNSGRDQASLATTGAGALLQRQNANANQNVTGPANKGGTPSSNPSAQPSGGAGTPAPTGYQGPGGLDRVPYQPPPALPTT